MSFRNTFVTDFIYAGADEHKALVPAMTEVFKEHTSILATHPDERGFGYYAGTIKTHNLATPLDELGAEYLLAALEKVTPVPFRLVIMQESGAVIIYNVEPRKAV